MYQMHSLKAFLAQLPKLCCKAQTGLEDGESAIGGAAPEGLVGLKSLLPLARTRKQPLTRAAVLLAFHGGREGAREESKGSLPYILGSPLSKKLPAAFFFFHHCHFTWRVFSHHLWMLSKFSATRIQISGERSYLLLYLQIFYASGFPVHCGLWHNNGACWKELQQGRSLAGVGEGQLVPQVKGLGKAPSYKKADGVSLPSKAPPSDYPLWQPHFWGPQLLYTGHPTHAFFELLQTTFISIAMNR